MDLIKMFNWLFTKKNPKCIRQEETTTAKVFYTVKELMAIRTEEFEPRVVNNGFGHFVISGKDRAENLLERLKKQTLIFVPGLDQWIPTNDISSIDIETKKVMIEVYEDETFKYMEL